jgi:hypothetical protein
MGKLTDHYEDVGPGWWALLSAMHSELEKVCPEYEALQVKEKFGGLRAYIDGHKEAFAIENRYEYLSYSVCEECGKAGKNGQWGSSWWKTYCPEHQKMREEKGPLHALRGKV